MKKNKLLIPIFMGMSYRNFVTSGIVNNLMKEYDVHILVDKGSSIEKLVQQEKINYLILENAFFQKVIKRLTTILEKMQYFNFYQKHKTNTMKKYILREQKKRSFKPLYLLSYIVGIFFNKYSFMSMHYQYFISKEMKNKIKKFDKVFIVSTDDLIDKAILKFCNVNSIETTVIVHSWDNLPARGFLSAKPNRILVWNEIMKEQAYTLHNIDYCDIKIVGVPQFYYYKSLSSKITYNDFKNFYNLLDNKKVITYTCSASRVFPDENLFIDKLIEYTKEIGVMLIIRLHPTERHGEYIKNYSDTEDVVLDLPSGNFAATSTSNTNNNIDEILKFISLMKYSNIVINLASTITLDATIFDTPVICPAFNVDKTIDQEWNNAKEWYKSTHFKTIIESSAIVVSNDLKNMKIDINNYLEDKEYLKQNRIKLAKEFCNIDINSSKEILKYV